MPSCKLSENKKTKTNFNPRVKLVFVISEWSLKQI